jgi:hypothetical protein
VIRGMGAYVLRHKVAVLILLATFVLLVAG